MQRHSDKISQVLRFLRTEIYTTTPVVQELLDLSERPARMILGKMLEQGLLIRYRIAREHSNGFLHDLWGITAVGQGQACEPQANERPAQRSFRPTEVRATLLKHTLQLQRARIAAISAGWSDWMPGTAMGQLRTGEARPNATVLTPDGQRWAVELERTPKAPARYARVLFERLAAIKAGQFDHCVWICTDQVNPERLGATIKRIECVRDPRTQLTHAIHPRVHHRRLSFLRLDQWPPAISPQPAIDGPAATTAVMATTLPYLP